MGLVWLEQEPDLEELQLVEVLVRRTLTPFVLKRAYLADSEVDGSERGTDAMASPRR